MTGSCLSWSEEKETTSLLCRRGCGFGGYPRFADVPFHLDFNLVYPDADQIPYIESGDYVAYNNEKGGVIERIKKDGIIDLDNELYSVLDWISTKAMLTSWLADAFKSSMNSGWEVMVVLLKRYIVSISHCQ
ncbi:mitochondrial outer membrane import complex protein METAXIN [Morus notabilis]|nr:mitochondrial outer membrane import complex protein METAXIN [Morus notabilis]